MAPSTSSGYIISSSSSFDASSSVFASSYTPTAPAESAKKLAAVMLWLSEPLALLGVDLQEVPGRWLLEEINDV
jgi:hypothetical protein